MLRIDVEGAEIAAEGGEATISTYRPKILIGRQRRRACSIRDLSEVPRDYERCDALQPICKCFCDECVANRGEVTMVIEKEKI